MNCLTNIETFIKILQEIKMTITPMGEVYPETGAFPPPYKNSNNDVKEINVNNIQQFIFFSVEKTTFYLFLHDTLHDTH